MQRDSRDESAAELTAAKSRREAIGCGIGNGVPTVGLRQAGNMTRLRVN
jgi:hypothetical protein